MADLKSVLVRSTAACVLVCASSLTHAENAPEPAAISHVPPAELSASAGAPSTQRFVGDDPVAIRDALAKLRIKAESPSLGDRVRSLVHVPAGRTPDDIDLAKAGLDRELTFVIPASYGILYRSSTHRLTVDVDLSGDDVPGLIQLQKTITGRRGRHLVVAAEAKAMGYVQHIDLIELKVGEKRETSVKGHVTLSPALFAKMAGDFAIVLKCDIMPPYLTEESEHSDPTNEEPTDITTRTSTLHATIHAIWLVSPQHDIVLSKKLHLSK
ncbi:hypothetical protein [Paraburkholderia gardini]|uniref:Uncharacterized protein n=1 Tax=Paraburkholderia gardini TaxID=2823469 RepID=A0ABM8U1U8_9BURK|nr:hypothetical protein [Paraburkholderia gardini]CAG4894631.1 hypothetical protein R54767_01780 [Paraburkholderia gardini]